MTDERRCRACGRIVGETMHTRSGYRVDGFALHTGPTEEAVFRRSDENGRDVLYRRLLEPISLLTCADCYAEPAGRARHHSWEYPGD